MIKALDGLVIIITLIFLIIYYRPTRDYSKRYQIRGRRLARIIVFLSLINLFLLVSLEEAKASNYTFLIIQLIFLGIDYLYYKGVLRTAQSLADINWLRGSSLLKDKFSWNQINWKLILKINFILFIWTVLVFRIGNVQLNPLLFKEITVKSSWPLILNNLLVICIIAPIIEEVIYRFLGVNLFLHWLGKEGLRKWIAFLIPSLIWMFLHAGILSNNVLKFIQVLPLGIAASYILYKEDLEHSILTHMTFNIVAVIIT